MKVDSALSRPFILKEGVPQGSVLSVICFALAFNDIVDELPSGVKCSMYVDDFVIYCVGQRAQHVHREIQMTIHKVAAWAGERGFRFSAPKTKAMIFSRRTSDVQMDQLVLLDSPIPFVSSARLLGLILDTRMEWGPQVNALRLSCQGPLNAVGILSKINYGACRKVLQMATSFVESKLDYGAAVYGTAARRVLDKLLPVRNETLRKVTGAFRTSPSTAMHVEANEIGRAHV